MEMRSPAETVADHLDHHHGLVSTLRGTHVRPRNGRSDLCPDTRAIRKLWLQIEPTIALKLLLQKNNTYRIETVKMITQSIDPHSHYDVDFEATMRL